MLWLALVATVFLMSVIFYLFSHPSVRGAFSVRKPRDNTCHETRHWPGETAAPHKHAALLAVGMIPLKKS